MKRPFPKHKKVGSEYVDTCEFCNAVIQGIREEHPCYAVEAATQPKEVIRSIALILDGHPGYALVIPEGSGYRTAVDFVFSIIHKWPRKYLAKNYLPEIVLIATMGAVFGGLLVFLAT